MKKNVLIVVSDNNVLIVVSDNCCFCLFIPQAYGKT